MCAKGGALHRGPLSGTQPPQDRIQGFFSWKGRGEEIMTNDTEHFYGEHVLGGLGTYPHSTFIKIRCSEMNSGGFWVASQPLLLWSIHFISWYCIQHYILLLPVGGGWEERKITGRSFPPPPPHSLHEILLGIIRYTGTGTSIPCMCVFIQAQPQLDLLWRYNDTPKQTVLCDHKTVPVPQQSKVLVLP